MRLEAWLEVMERRDRSSLVNLKPAVTGASSEQSVGAETVEERKQQDAAVFSNYAITETAFVRLAEDFSLIPAITTKKEAIAFFRRASGQALELSAADQDLMTRSKNQGIMVSPLGQTEGPRRQSVMVSGRTLQLQLEAEKSRSKTKLKSVESLLGQVGVRDISTAQLVELTEVVVNQRRNFLDQVDEILDEVRRELRTLALDY